MSKTETPPPIGQTAIFKRVLLYALPYKGRIAGVIVMMLLFSLTAGFTYLLVRPLLDNHLSKPRDLLSSEEFEVRFTDGSRAKLSTLLKSDPTPWEEWLAQRPRLQNLLVSSAERVPQVKADIAGAPLEATAIQVFVPGREWNDVMLGLGEWKPILEAHPEFEARVQSFHQVPSTPEIHAPLWVYALLVPILFLIKGAFAVARQLLLASVALNVIRNIQNDLYSKILNQSVSFFRQARTGDLISRIGNDVTILSQQVVGVLTDLIQAPIMAFTCIALAFWVDWNLALTFIVVVPLLALPMQIMSRKIRKASRRAQEKRADISSVLVETLTGIEVVKAFNMEQYERERYYEETGSLLRREFRIRKARAFSSPATELAASFGISAVILIAMWRLSNDPTFQIGKLALVCIYFTQIIKPLDHFWKSLFILVEMAEAGKRIFSVMDAVPTIQDAPDAVDLPADWKTIRFDRVNFAYGAEPVLQDVSFEVDRGRKVAIVGKTGAGKSTLVHLLARFHDVTGGSISIGGLDVRSLKVQSLLGNIGIVTQRNILFNDTVARNIAYGRPDIPMEEIVRAAEAAYADEFVREMPLGYDTVIGEMGTRLSGGQAQRVSIARAILKNPPILILDEATASLDTESEQKVQAALDRLMKNRTTFAIAHRLSTILNADMILVLHQGRIVESGTHDELYARGGYYTQLYDAQFERE